MKLYRKILLLLTLLATTLTINAQEQQVEDADSTAAKFASVKISLLTCGGYDEVWALYGHSALRVEMPDTGDDVVANWGLFRLPTAEFHRQIPVRKVRLPYGNGAFQSVYTGVYG